MKTCAQGAQKSWRKTLEYLTFGHASAEAAAKAVPSELADHAGVADWNPHLVRRLQAYALGGHDDFLDVEVDLETRTEFQRRILLACRQIPFGQTRTYAQLAAQAGYPRAARAVGNCMAANPIPLVIPCHRVVASGGGLGGYSTVGGLRMKRRLLDLEAGSATD